jgi:hypothetical protein
LERVKARDTRRITAAEMKYVRERGQKAARLYDRYMMMMIDSVFIETKEAVYARKTDSCVTFTSCVNGCPHSKRAIMAILCRQQQENVLRSSCKVTDFKQIWGFSKYFYEIRQY